jgi:DNA polymerase-3 subunit alpha
VITGGVVDKLFKKITKKGAVMLFVTMQDRSGSMEYLVFPKLYEKMKDVWQEGNVMIIVGKTPRDEGDNKVFVENVYTLTPDNAQGVARQVSMGAEVSVQKEKEAEQFVTITLTREQLQEQGEALKELFAKHPGSARVYFSIDGKSVKTETFVDGSADFNGIIASL